MRSTLGSPDQSDPRCVQSRTGEDGYDLVDLSCAAWRHGIFHMMAQTCTSYAGTPSSICPSSSVAQYSNPVAMFAAHLHERFDFVSTQCTAGSDSRQIPFSPLLLGGCICHLLWKRGPRLLDVSAFCLDAFGPCRRQERLLPVFLPHARPSIQSP